MSKHTENQNDNVPADGLIATKEEFETFLMEAIESYAKSCSMPCPQMQPGLKVSTGKATFLVDVTEVKDEQIIGKITKYIGKEKPYLHGRPVRIDQVAKNAANPLHHGKSHDIWEITDNDAVLRSGGVTRYDRIAIRGWYEEDQIWSTFSFDAAAVELECYAHLAYEDD